MLYISKDPIVNIFTSKSAQRPI